MVTGNVGLVGGALAGSRWPLSRSRARLISVGGLMAGVGGVGVVLIAQPDDDNSAIAIPLVTSVAGLVIGAVLTEGDGSEEDTSGNVQTTGSLVSGALLNRSGGEWSLSAPLPFPVREPAMWADGRDALVWKVPLLNVHFWPGFLSAPFHGTLRNPGQCWFAGCSTGSAGPVGPTAGQTRSRGSSAGPDCRLPAKLTTYAPKNHLQFLRGRPVRPRLLTALRGLNHDIPPRRRPALIRFRAVLL